MTHNMCEKRRTTASNRGRNWRRSCRRRGSAPATTTPGRPAGGLQTDSSGRRSSARRAQTTSSRSRSPTAPGHCSASTSTRGQERGCGTRETSSPNAQPRPNALAIPRREAPSRCSRHARPATHPARLSKHTRTTPVEQCTSRLPTPIVEVGRGAKTNGANSAAPPQAE